MLEQAATPATEALRKPMGRQWETNRKAFPETGYLDEAFAYTGRLFDKNTGLQNNLNRWYDPKIGRWLSQDPKGFAAGDANLYRYVGNSPTNFKDHTGLGYDHINGRRWWCRFSMAWPSWDDWKHAAGHPLEGDPDLLLDKGLGVTTVVILVSMEGPPAWRQAFPKIPKTPIEKAAEEYIEQIMHDGHVVPRNPKVVPPWTGCPN